MASSDLVSLDAKTVTLHGAGRSDAHEVTLRKTELSAVALGTAWDLPSTTFACFLGVLTALPLAIAHVIERWLVQGVVVAIVLLGSSIMMFWAARRAELVVRAHNGESVFRARYPPWQVDRCLDTFRRLETAMGRHERMVPHPIDARIQLLWDNGNPRRTNEARPTGTPSPVPAPTVATPHGAPAELSAPDATPAAHATAPTAPSPNAASLPNPRPATAPTARPARGNPWFEHILAASMPPGT